MRPLTVIEQMKLGVKFKKAMVGKNFVEQTLKHSAKVLPLAAMTSTIKVRGEAVVIDQQRMLNRVLAVLQSGSELKNFSSMNLSTMPHPFLTIFQ